MMRILLAVILALGFVACDSGNGGGDQPPADTTQLLPDQAGSGDETGTPGACVLGDLTGKTYRLTVLESQEPTDALNPTFAVDIATHINILVFHIVEHNLEEGYAMMTAGPCSADFVDPDAEERVPTAFYYALEPEPFRVEFKDCRFEIKEAAVLDMMFETLNKPYRVDSLFGNGVLREDLSGIDDGHLEGGILVDTAINLCTTIPGFGVVNFHWFMNLAHICANFDTDGDQQNDAYYFAGTFNAEDVSDLFVPDEIVPIKSLVEVCEPHDDPCIPVE